MAQQHLDRLTPQDATFLHQESANAHMHVGGVALFEGPAPSFAAFVDHIRGRLHLVPRYRQRLAVPPGGSGRPLWIDDSSFNLEFHVRHLALPAPGSEAQLLEMTARLASQPLDRSRPLWELYLVEGIEPVPGSDHRRFALITKNHHALVDGISGVDLATVLLDLEANPPEIDTAGLRPWQPQPEPSVVELIRAGLGDSARAAARTATQLLDAATQPARAVDVVRDASEGVGTLLWAALNHAPETPLNVPIGPHRRYLVVRQELADYRLVKDTFGGTVNDVVLAVVTGGLRRWLRGRGIRTEGVELRALVPVSVRTEAQRHTLGNRLALMRGPLPVYVQDPVTRLAVVTQAMADLKESKQALGAAALVAVESLAPPAVLAQASRLQFSTRLFNLLVTNIPGPQVPLYILGKQLQDLFPLAFLPDGHALAVAIMSYDGRLEYGLLGDFDAMPDLAVVAEGIETSLTELVAAARTRARTPEAAEPRAGAPEPAEPPTAPASTLSLAPHHRPASGPAAELRAKRMRSASRAKHTQEKPSLPSKPTAKQGPAPRRKSS